ncbi:hypothetical protein [Bradyrhizobium sp. Arg816]|uniref:hypothetical protein n=1 Tax=Bradyrhizobium sp. Arg816 TaxID=2998491 RepID=UPI00249EA84D|nr:hypothetical protein [Bradyrhizobium sp. Arg816]MDI3567244.1 hypothetical protein [Bradyrhizobium sp. Arg816]
MKWFGQVNAVLKEAGDILIMTDVAAAVSGLQQFANRAEYFQKIMLGLYQALAITELKAPQVRKVPSRRKCLRRFFSNIQDTWCRPL